MKPETYEFLKLRWNYNVKLIEGNLVGCGTAALENAILNEVILSEGIKYDCPDFPNPKKQKLENEK